MHLLDLNLLAALDALLQEGSVVGAAKRLRLTPPAMSRALSRLRAATGNPLFVRAGRGLVPTPRASELRERAHAALAEARALLSPETPADPRLLRRTFTVRADDAVTAVLGPPLLARLKAIAPGITVVFAAEGDEDVSALRAGGIDLDIGVQGPLGPEIRCQLLFEDERVVLMRRRGSASRKQISLRDYAAQVHVDVSRRGRLRGPIDAVLEKHGLSRHVAAVVPNQLAAAILVAQSDAISLVSRRFAVSIGPVLGVRCLKVPAALGSAPIAMAWHPRFDADTGHRWFRDEIRKLKGA
jgi:DNA-binding transcriptional LysR family regulator